VQNNILTAAFFWVIAQRVVLPHRGPLTSVRITTTTSVTTQKGAGFICFEVEACNYETNSSRKGISRRRLPVSDDVHSV